MMVTSSGRTLVKPLGPRRWMLRAPWALPKPMPTILHSPLSISRMKLVCGLTRAMKMAPSAPAALGVHAARDAVRGGAELAHLHGRPDRRADGFLGDAEFLQHRRLAFGGAAAVAAHGRDDERLVALLLQVDDRSPGHAGDVGDPAAAHADGDAGAGRKRVQLLRLGQLTGDPALEIGNRHPPRMAQADTHHRGQRNVFQHRQFDSRKGRGQHHRLQTQFPNKFR